MPTDMTIFGNWNETHEMIFRLTTSGQDYLIQPGEVIFPVEGEEIYIFDHVLVKPHPDWVSGNKGGIIRVTCENGLHRIFRPSHFNCTIREKEN